MYKKTISFFLSFVIIFSFLPTASADYVNTPQDGVLGFFELFLHRICSGAEGSGFGFVNEIIGQWVGPICEVGSDSYHHADSLKGCDIFEDEHGQFAMATCMYCGDKFKCYSSDLSAAYDTYVTDLPAGSITSDNSLVYYLERTTNKITTDYYTSAIWVDNEHFVVERRDNSRPNFALNFFYEGISPVSGTYVFDKNFSCVVKSSEGILYSNYIYDIWKDGLYSSGTEFTFSLYTPRFDLVPGIFTFYVPSAVPFYVTPLEGFDFTLYNVNSRPASISGDYGIIGDNGTIIKSDTQYIINETNNTYTNPATGTTETITNWTYDYSDRSYNITTESGDTITITYGDENITINEGDTVYNIYYVTEVPEDGGGDIPSSPPPACNHSYTSTTTTVPTCEAPGLETLTCSKCGHSYTQKLPATGHTWTIKQTVATEYDESGNIIQQGYTIYKCSVCSTEYKDDAGTGPPNNSVDNSGKKETIWDKIGKFFGTIGDGILGIFEGIVSKLLDGLISLAEMIMEKLTKVVDVVLSMFDQLPRLFTGFLDFLTAAFAFMPDDVILLLTFGIAAVVFISIFKIWRK